MTCGNIHPRKARFYERPPKALRGDNMTRLFNWEEEHITWKGPSYMFPDDDPDYYSSFNRRVQDDEKFFKRFFYPVFITALLFSIVFLGIILWAVVQIVLHVTS